MFTPATTASSTSAPWVIIWNAFSTQVTLPPFLNRLPLAAETTTGLTARPATTCGPWAGAGWGAAAATPTAALPRTNDRRDNLLPTADPLCGWCGYGPA